MRHRTSTSILVIILVCMTLLLMLGVAQAQQPVFRIGVLDDIRGSVSDGARLAVQRINETGGVRGADGTIFRLELVIQPTNFGQNLEAAVVSLDQQDVIAVIGPEQDVLIEENLLLLQSLNVPVLVPATGDTILASDTTRRLFRVRSAELWQGRALASYLVEALGLDRVATVQLDLPSTTGIIGFSAAIAELGVSPAPVLLFETETDLFDLVQQSLVADPQAVVVYGAPAIAAQFYTALRAGGYQGLFVYPEADDPLFKNSVSFEQLFGIIGSTTWTFSAPGVQTSDFLTTYVRSYGDVPDPVAAASYDAVMLIAAAIGRPGELGANLAALADVPGVQGLLRPADFGQGDTITDVYVIELGRFGAPVVLARYRDGEAIPLEEPEIILPTPIPATPTPLGVVVSITSPRQNVRTGPGLEYPVIGQLNRGEQARVLGATADLTWVVIDFRGVQGWLATYLADIFGDLNSVPIIQPPPTPTPNVTPTPIPPPEADLLIDSITLSPLPILPGNPFTANVIIRNQGNTAAGPFAVGGTFPPNNVLASAVVGGLPAGQSIAVTLQGQLTNTGFYTTSVLVDINNQVPEGVLGELNNTYNVNYVVDELILAQGSQALNLGDTIDVEDDAVQGDANWNGDGGVALDAIFGARLGVLPVSDLSQVHWDLINPSFINRESIPRGELVPGMILGMLTADGRRAALRVDGVSDTQISLTYRTYRR